MGLSSLEIQHFRNLQSVQIKPDAGLNIIVGDNAAGKTSLLESIFYLSYGRSFRNSQIKHLINHNKDYFRLISILEEKDARLGIERNINEHKIRLNQQNITKISELSTLLPVLSLHPDSHQLISAGPEHRRQFLDWGVFHVEHQFISSWKKYKKALKQRNAALRLQHPDKLCILWNAELIEHAMNIQKYRLSYLESIGPIISDLAEILFPDLPVEIIYKQGWKTDYSYQEYLTAHLSRDKEKGFTQSGPHRADLKILLGGQSTQASISRGQQKKLVTLLKIAQLTYFSQNTKSRCVLLFDDLPAELDTDNQKKIMSILSKLDIQLFISAITTDLISYSDWSTHKVFHVEHGQINEICKPE